MTTRQASDVAGPGAHAGAPENNHRAGPTPAQVEPKRAAVGPGAPPAVGVGLPPEQDPQIINSYKRGLISYMLSKERIRASAVRRRPAVLGTPVGLVLGYWLGKADAVQAILQQLT